MEETQEKNQKIDWSKAEVREGKKSGSKFEVVKLANIEDVLPGYGDVAGLRVSNGEIVAMRPKPKTEAEKQEQKRKTQEKRSEIKRLKQNVKDEWKEAEKNLREEYKRAMKNHTSPNPSFAETARSKEEKWKAVKSIQKLDQLKEVLKQYSNY